MDNTAVRESSVGYYGWVVVGMGFLAGFVGFGFVYSYGVFFKPLSSEFGWSRSLIAGAFSLYAVLHNLLAFFAGRAVDTIGPKPILAVAGISLGASMIVMSRVDSVWELYVYFGILFSIGLACIFSPVMATVSRWFDAKRGFAAGITATGIGTGALVFSPLSAWLISTLGWRQSYVVLGIVAWVVFVPIVIFVREAPARTLGAASPGTSADGLSFGEAIKTMTFWAIALSLLCLDIAIFALMMHIVMLASDRGMSIVLSGSIAGLIGGASLFGRIGAGYFSDHLGRKRVYILACIFQLVMFIWLFFAVNTWMLIVFAVFFGVSYGSWAGIMGVLPADYFGYRATGEILGCIVIICGVGVAIGPFLGGLIYDTTGSYDYMIVMCVAATICAAIMASFMKPVTTPDTEGSARVVTRY